MVTVAASNVILGVLDAGAGIVAGVTAAASASTLALHVKRRTLRPERLLDVMRTVPPSISAREPAPVHQAEGGPVSYHATRLYGFSTPSVLWSFMAAPHP